MNSVFFFFSYTFFSHMIFFSNKILSRHILCGMIIEHYETKYIHSGLYSPFCPGLSKIMLSLIIVPLYEQIAYMKGQKNYLYSEFMLKKQNDLVYYLDKKEISRS